MVAGRLAIDPAAFTVRKDGAEIALTATEFRLLVELAKRPGQVFTRELLLQRVWDYDYVGDSHLVDVAIGRLRAKVEDDPARPALIKTVRGVGYRLDRTQCERGGAAAAGRAAAGRGCGGAGCGAGRRRLRPRRSHPAGAWRSASSCSCARPGCGARRPRPPSGRHDLTLAAKISYPWRAGSCRLTSRRSTRCWYFRAPRGASNPW
jgi:DNA-binding winged helix-turn-helix (wHTH) protein